MPRLKRARRSGRNTHPQPPSLAASSSSSSLRFFKLMVGEDLSAKKWLLPQNFVRNFGSDFDKEAMLKCPDGSAWEIEVLKEKNQIWVGGPKWYKFVEHYSIVPGYFLYFTYKGSSTFKVHINDLTTCEINYSSKTPTQPPSAFNFKTNHDTEIEDDSIELVEISHSSSASTDSNYSSSTPTESSFSSHESNRKKIAASSSKRRRGGADDEKIANDVGVSYTVGFRKSCKEYENVIQAARLFKSNKPSFMVLLLPYNFKSNIVYFPCQFVAMHMKKIPHSVKLQTSKGHQWPVAIAQKSNGRLSLGNGWKLFAMENNLEKGNICVFSLCEKNVFQVSIVR